MANAKRCDRCGKYYTTNKFMKSVFTPQLYVTGIQRVWGDGDTGKIIDLCDDCQAKLSEFLEERK